MLAVLLSHGGRLSLPMLCCHCLEASSALCAGEALWHSTQATGAPQGAVSPQAEELCQSPLPHHQLKPESKAAEGSSGLV